MYAHVIPSLRLPRMIDSFDYRIPETLDCQPGDIVFIPFRNRKIFGVIDELSQTPRKITGNIKDVTSVYPGPSLCQQQLTLVREFAKYFFVSRATVVNSILQTLPRRFSLSSSHEIMRSVIKPVSDFQAALNEDSLLFYNTDNTKSKYITELIKRYLTNKSSVFLVAPEISRVRDWERLLKEHLPVVLHRQLPPRIYWSHYQKQLERNSGLIIGTRSALFTPLPAVRLIIIDEEDNQNHRQAEMNPRYHSEDVARIIARSTKARILMTSRAPRTTTMYRVENKTLNCIDIRIKLPAPKTKIINLNDEKRLGNYTLVSGLMRSHISEMIQKKETLLLFHNKLGEASSFRCLDCGNPFSCPRCQKALIVKKEPKGFLRLHCTLCGYTGDLPLACPVCQSVRLKQRGAGLQKIAAEISASFPQAKIQILSSARAPAINDNADIIIGAQRALDPAILHTVKSIIIVSADTLLRLPDFSAPEATYRQLAFISQFTAEHGLELIIQTSFPDHYAIRSAVTLDANHFYQNEFRQRSEYKYPPAAELVRIFIKGKSKKTISELAQKLYTRLLETKNVPATIDILNPGPSFIEKIRGQFSWQLIMKFPAEDWPTVRNLISLTTDDWLVDINPLNLLS